MSEEANKGRWWDTDKQARRAVEALEKRTGITSGLRFIDGEPIWIEPRLYPNGRFTFCRCTDATARTLTGAWQDMTPEIFATTTGLRL